MFDLYLMHGRTSPDQQLADWGFEGPRLSGVLGVHQTYCCHVTVVFINAAAAEAAQLATGWQGDGADRLVMSFESDLVRCGEGGAGALSYFGDWGLMIPPGHREAAERQRAALSDALSFVTGFEGDELQEGIDGPHGLLARLQAAHDAAWHSGDPAAAPRAPSAQTPPDPLADLAPDIRARLVDEMGFEPELMGGGCYGLRSAARRYYCLVTGADGGLPAAESWQVGLYDGQDDSHTCLWNAVHWTDGPADCREVSPLSLFEAVNACLSIIAEREGH